MKNNKSDYYKAVEETLCAFRYFEPHIQKLKMELDQVDLLDGINGIDYSKDKCHGGMISSITESIALEKIELKNELQRRIKYHEGRKAMIMMAIESLDPVECEIIKLHYFEGATWSEIARSVRYSRSRCISLKREAIENLIIVFYGDRCV